MSFIYLLLISTLIFFMIGISYPIVIKCEYYYGTKYWYIFLIIAIISLIISLFISNEIISCIIGGFAALNIWIIVELFEQPERVEKGYFPINPKRKNEYHRKLSKKEKNLYKINK